MRTRLSTISFLFLFNALQSQSVKNVYSIDGLLNRINHPDTTYVVNFWATWCKPCVQELPAFDSLYKNSKNLPLQVILVSLDFKEDIQKKVNPFLKSHQVQSPCVLLDEVNGNNYINKVSPQWSGAIPATLFKHGKKQVLLEQKIKLRDLESQVKLIE
ncbi:MAG: TlpA disulfide reductase family protein [Bacteroidota bacterium]